MYSCGPLHVDEQRQDDQLEPIHIRSVPIRDVTLMTYRKQWMIGKWGERGLGVSVSMARILQLVPTSLWCSTAVWALWQGPSSCISFRFLLNPLDGAFFFFLVINNRSALLLLLLLLFYFFDSFFYTIISWWFSTGVWVTASLLKSQGLSPSCSIVFSVLKQGPSTYLSFRFLSILLTKFSRFSFLLTITRSGRQAKIVWSVCI